MRKKDLTTWARTLLHKKLLRLLFRCLLLIASVSNTVRHLSIPLSHLFLDYSASVGHFASLLASMQRRAFGLYLHLAWGDGWLMTASCSHEGTMIQWRTTWANSELTLQCIHGSQIAAISWIYMGWKCRQEMLPHTVACIYSVCTHKNTEHLVL